MYIEYIDRNVKTPICDYSWKTPAKYRDFVQIPRVFYLTHHSEVARFDMIIPV